MPWDYEAKKVNWAYVAGFTDGEGHIRMRRSKLGVTSFQIALYQNEANSWVLYEIQDFLQEHDIDARMYEDGRSDARHPTKGYFLYIRRVKDVYRFCKAIQPHAIVKSPAVNRILAEIEAKKETSTHPVYHGW